MIDGLFSDKNDQSLVTMVSQRKSDTRYVYIIPKGN